MSRLSRRQRPSEAAPSDLPNLRRRDLRGLSWRRREMDRDPYFRRRHAPAQRRERPLPQRRPGDAGAALPVVPFRRRAPLRHSPHHGRRPPADELRTRHLHLDPAGSFRFRRRLPKAEGILERRPDLGDRPISRPRLPVGLDHRARARRNFSGIRGLRLLRLPPPHEQAALESADWHRTGPGSAANP